MILDDKQWSLLRDSGLSISQLRDAIVLSLSSGSRDGPVSLVTTRP